jgi:Meiotic cell cortex C-terminal pleckstrin homology
MLEFAFEIGSGLLTEVRRLQSLLAERDKAIQDMKEEKDDLEKSVENLRTALRQQEQSAGEHPLGTIHAIAPCLPMSADKFKEENWNLEVTLQEIRAQLSESQADTQRLEGEHKRLTKLLAASRDAGDQHKNESERLKNALEDLKIKHETDVAQARKYAAGLQRDKSDLQQVVDNMKNEAARAKRLPRFGSPITPNGPASEFLTPNNDDDVFSVPVSTNNRKKYDTSGLFAADLGEFADSSPDPSPAKPFLAANHPNNEIEALQQRLTHAQRQINTLKGTLQREKEIKLDYRRKLQSSPGFAAEGEEVDDDTIFEDTDAGLKSKPRSTPYRSGGKTRGRGGRTSGLTLVQRLAMAPNSPSSEYNLDDEALDHDVPPPVPPIPIRFQQAGDGKDVMGDEGQEQEEDNDRPARSPSPLESQSNRVSVDGMDPAFANVLRRVSSSGSYNGSPLRQSVLAGAARGGTMGRRRGNAYQEARPASLVGQPEALAAELGLGMAPQLEDELLDEPLPKETQEIGCQTDFEEPLPVVLIPPVPIKPETAEMAVQVEPEPEIPPAPAKAIVTSEVAAQTDDEPIIPKSEAAVQYVYVESRPVLVSTSTNTEPELPPPTAQAGAQTPLVATVDNDTQTPPSPTRVDIEVQTMVSSTNLEVFPSMGADEERGMRAGTDADRRTTITQRTLSLARLAELSGETTITTPRAFLAARNTQEEDEDDGNETETGAETETDGEEYHDAPQSAVGMSTPSESLEDFHSVLTMTDNDFSESEDEVSIKASHMSRRQNTTTSSVGEPRPSSYYAPIPAVTYESKEISVIPIEEPKPELKEISIQTDEWTPPAPEAPAPNLGLSLYRVGSGNQQQFQFISSPTSSSRTSTPVPIAVPVPSAVFRDSAATFGPRGRLSQADRRQSIESAISSLADESPSRSRVPSGTAIASTSNTLSPVDKTKPPTMVLPPPPRLPPPPSSMPPPNFIPDRKQTLVAKPPPRPSSPPPAELIQRATTPTFGTVLSVGKSTYGRQHGSSMPPSQPGLRQLPSTSSFRSAANAATYAQNLAPSHNALPTFHLSDRGRKEFSTTSFASDRSPRSSISSERHLYENQARRDAPPEPPVTPNKAANTSRGGPATDPAVIHAITQTMIGEFLYKYTRRPIGKGHGERRHKRFFWVHPYTKTLYWSSADPGSSNVSESSAKSGMFLFFISECYLDVERHSSAYIDGVRDVLDPNPMPPGLHQYSIVISTPQREMKFTAPTQERHEIWLNVRHLIPRALSFLLTTDIRLCRH